MTVDRRPLLARDPRFRDHTPAGMHPERPERLLAIERALAPLAGDVRDVSPRPATDEQVLRAHRRDHLERLRSLAGRRSKLDTDTYAAPASFDTALLAAGATADLALRVARGEARSGFALVRPPGHHAESAEAMGFCLLNNVAIAARALQAEAGIERIAILDWDVHHGNGTQHLFESERDVLFVSLHQFPLYPGTGALGEQGEGRGAGSTVNFPLPPGCGDSEYEAVFGGVVLPILREFRPEAILVSAGFDAHERDPLAQMRVSSAGFARLARGLRELADDVCGGRVVLALEGGYDLDALGESVAGVVRALSGQGEPDQTVTPETEAAQRLREVFQSAHSRHWKSLRDPSP